MRLAVCALIWLMAGVPGIGQAAPADGFFYLPPNLADRVVFYHSFGKGLKTPDLNLIGASLTLAENTPAPGVVGPGYMSGSGTVARAKGGFRLHSPALSPHRPMTVMLWWRLDEPMREEKGFGVIALRGKGWISTFVAGKGPWCALKEPTYVFQCYNFPGMENCNDVWGGRAWFEPGVWHHAAMTVSGAADIRIYWDGKLRTQYAPKKRLFQEGEIDSVELGASGNSPAMTLDEIVILDRALGAEEILSYMTAVNALAQVGFVFGASAK
jgi:hypothetical protein